MSPAAANKNFETRVALLERSSQETSQQLVEIRTSQQLLSSQLTSIEQKMAGGGKPNWSNWIAFIGIIFVLGGILWSAISLQTNGQINPIVQTLTAQGKQLDILTQVPTHLASIDVQNKISELDRSKMNSILEKLTDGQSNNRAQIAHLDMVSAEIETQVRSLENYAALIAANNEQKIAMVYEKVFGARYPSDVHFTPMISKQKDISAPK
jgi:hypothetical protein